ncbi:MAG: hypothetical protein CFE45_41280, partial [Burkholderiales bacterium PBB5]
FAAGFLNTPDADLLAGLQALAHAAPAQAPSWSEAEALGDEVEAVDEVAATEALLPAQAEPEPAPVPEPIAAPVAAPPVAELEPAPSPFAEHAAAALGRAALLPFEALPETAARVSKGAGDDRLGGFEEDLDQTDAVDPDLLPIFTDEMQDLLPRLQTQLRAWAGKPADADAA